MKVEPGKKQLSLRVQYILCTGWKEKFVRGYRRFYTFDLMEMYVTNLPQN